MAAAMAAGMTPPLGIALAYRLFREPLHARGARGGQGRPRCSALAFITEGAIPFAARDPLRVIPACVLGLGRGRRACRWRLVHGLQAPHGGVFVLAIPNAVVNLPMYIVAILAGTAVSTGLLGLLKKPVVETPAISNVEVTSPATD